MTGEIGFGDDGGSRAESGRTCFFEKLDREIGYLGCYAINSLLAYLLRDGNRE